MEIKGANNKHVIIAPSIYAKLNRTWIFMLASSIMILLGLADAKLIRAFEHFSFPCYNGQANTHTYVQWDELSLLFLES